ncbi:ScbR family autoregulator-binding transcription factor [Streptomyces sp. NPDC059943]|uniref:ScbR family autoregulator-binding transcription factor n=1 Tax=Streptomyces sp. NPDC059943 TaxID=3347010 RepID=UPI00365FE2B7
MVRQERAARTRRSLIRAAAETFAEVGFVPASLTVISRRAGVSNGALHFHFANKGVLAEAVEAEAAEAVRRLTESARARQGDSLQAVVDATHELMAALAQDVVVRGGFGLAGDIARRAVSPLHGQWQGWVEDSLCRAERSGALARGVSWTAAARVVVAATTGFGVLGCKDASWLSRQNITRSWELLLPLLADRGDLGTLVCAGSRPPAPAPEPGPALVPASAPVPGPELGSALVPAPGPELGPAFVPAAAPVPGPSPVPGPEPAALPAPEFAAAPAPVPAPAPVSGSGWVWGVSGR